MRRARVSSLYLAGRCGCSAAAMEEATAAAASAASSPSTPQVVKTTLADDLPRIRLDWKERLVHGLESTKFTVEVHHGGYFVGSGQTISYLDEKSTVWFDNLDRNTFNIETLCSMIDQLGYEKRRFIFWCPPGKAIDELMEVVWLKHCKLMAEASVESKVLVLFLHHPDDNEQQVKDELSHGESSEDSEKEDDFQCDSDEDPAWHDSDYDMKEDDELFVENVDDSEVDEMVDKGKQNSAQHAHVLGVDDVNEVDLELPVDDESERRHKSDSDDEEYKKKKKKKLVVYKFKAFNSAGDMNDPKFKTGMIFDSVEVVRKAVSQYAINERVQIRKKRNNQKRFEAFCEGETTTGELCTWKLIVVKYNKTVDFLVKCYVGEHTCERVWEVKELTAPFLAQQYVKMFRDNDRMSLKTFARKVRKKYNMEPSRYKLGRARKAALTVVHGDEIKQFSLQLPPVRLNRRAVVKAASMFKLISASIKRVQR
ncbi:hypothetical protein ACQ4PT_067213 [Festuca glaucescens]